MSVELAEKTADVGFEEVVNRHLFKTTVALEGIVEAIKAVKKKKPSCYDSEYLTRFNVEQRKSLDGLLDSYFLSSFAQHYPFLCASIFGLKRYLSLAKDGKSVVSDTTKFSDKSYTFECPLFVSVKINGNTKRVVKLHEGKYDYNTVKIEATLPGLPSNVIMSMKKANAVYHGIMAEVYGNEVLCDLVDSPPVPEFHAIWIPTAESLNVTIETPPKRDPALVLAVGNRSYLVTTWEIDQEKPFEHYLREFTASNGNFWKSADKK
jgi:hypothetical protein